MSCAETCGAPSAGTAGRTKPRTVAGAAALAEHARELYDEKRIDGGMVTRWEAEALLAAMAAGLQHLSKRAAP